MIGFARHVGLAAIAIALAGRSLADEANSATEADKATPTSNEKTVAEIARQAQPSVVVITTGGRNGEEQGLGTGFVVSADGLIATNLHVIGEARPISVKFSDGREQAVTAVHASDRSLDLAVVRVDARGLPTLEFGDEDQIQQGQRVVAIGNPLGLRHSLVEGIISARRRMEGRDMIQLAIPIERGNSGGPVLDRQGRVIGIVTMKSAVTANLGFAIQVNHLRRLLDKPNPVPIEHWLRIGSLDPRQWTSLFGAQWQQRAGRITVQGAGQGFGGRALCLSAADPPDLPYELGVSVRLDDEAGAAGLAFHSDGEHRHYGFYPSAGRLRLSRFEGPNVFSWTVLDEVVSAHYRPGQWNHLKVRIEQDGVSCYVNDQLVIQSSDRRLPRGRIGLAKFRQTTAQFRHFEVARKIGSRQVSPEVVSRVRQLVEKLPAFQDTSPGQLQQLARDDPTSSRILRQRADELQKLADDVHTRAVTSKLAELVAAPANPKDIARAALLISQLDNEEVVVEEYAKEIERMANQVLEQLDPGADESQRLRALNEYLFTSSGFHGSRTDYYHRANSYLDRVIDDREGLPITLSVLYMALGGHIDLKIEGVGLPGHFVVRHAPKQGKPQLIDVFEGGKLMSREDVEQTVLQYTRRPLREEDLRAATGQEIIVRMLRNLLNLAEQSSDKSTMLRYLEAMVAVAPEEASYRGMRAVVRFDTGRRRAALDDLDWFLEHQPEGVDLNGIRQLRERFEQQGQ